MSIIAFWSDEKKETGQTLSMIALSTYMAITHNYRILDVSTNFNDSSIEDCFWVTPKENFLGTQASSNVGLEAGVEGLIKIINSNKTSNSIVANYARVVFKERFDVLCSTKTKNYEEYKTICEKYADIVQVANRDYDLVFVDISRKMPQEQQKQLLELADVIIFNVAQKSNSMSSLDQLRNQNAFFKKSNVMLHLGKYDRFSKYNVKNVSRYFKQVKEVTTVPYNTLFFEASTEGKVAEFFLRFRGLASKEKKLFSNEEDRNAFFMKEMDRFSESVIYKIQELQMKS